MNIVNAILGGVLGIVVACFLLIVYNKLNRPKK